MFRFDFKVISNLLRRKLVLKLKNFLQLTFSPARIISKASTNILFEMCRENNLEHLNHHLKCKIMTWSNQGHHKILELSILKNLIKSSKLSFHYPDF